MLGCPSVPHGFHLVGDEPAGAQGEGHDGQHPARSAAVSLSKQSHDPPGAIPVGLVKVDPGKEGRHASSSIVSCISDTVPSLIQWIARPFTGLSGQRPRASRA